MMSAKQLCFLLLIAAAVCHVSTKHVASSKSTKSKTVTDKEGDSQPATSECDGNVRGFCVDRLQGIFSSCSGDEEDCTDGVSSTDIACTCVDGKRYDSINCKEHGIVDGCHYGEKVVATNCTNGVGENNNGCVSSVQFSCYNNETTRWRSCLEYGVDNCYLGYRMDFPVPCTGGEVGTKYDCPPNDVSCVTNFGVIFHIH